jgi:hypothetical protein
VEDNRPLLTRVAVSQPQPQLVTELQLKVLTVSAETRMLSGRWASLFISWSAVPPWK